MGSGFLALIQMSPEAIENDGVISSVMDVESCASRTFLSACFNFYRKYLVLNILHDKKKGLAAVVPPVDIPVSWLLRIATLQGGESLSIPEFDTAGVLPG